MTTSAPLIEEPVLLVGTTRSGTTLLSLMLGHHPEIAFAGEFEWPWDFMPETATPPLEAYYDWLTTNRHFRHHGLTIDRSLALPDQLRRFLADMRAQVDPRFEKPHVGVQVHRHYERALELWSRARFIHIVRDGRDVAASWIKFGWLGNAHVAAHRWNAALEEWKRLRARLDPQRFIELRYEDLIAEPEQQLTRLAEFLGTTYDERMMRYHEDTTYGPVDAGRGGRWRKSLSTRDLALFEASAGQALVDNGYELSGDPVYPTRPWTEPWLQLDDRLRHNRARIRDYGAGLWFAEHVSRRLGIRVLRDAVVLRINEIQNSRVQ